MKKRMTSMLLVLCMVIAMLPTFTINIAFATETDADAKWEFEAYKDGVVLTKYLGNAEDVYIPYAVETADGTLLTVLKLGDGVFEKNTSINSATFGEGITEIGESAFEGATNLVCIVSPETLTTIGDRAFYGCESFNSVILYDSVTNIGADAFAGCEKLTVWCNENTAAYDYVTANAIPYEILNPNATPETYVQDGVTYYIMNGEAYAILAEDSVTDIIIPATVEGYPMTEIRTAFKAHPSLRSIILPNSITSIDRDAFYDCANLVSLDIPNSVASVGIYAFYKCVRLTTVKLSDSITSIGSHTFDSCSSLTSIEIPKSVTHIDDSAFFKCTNLTSIEIPDSITSIGSHTFSECSSLISVEIPDSVTSIGNGVFSDCFRLKSVKLSDSITSVGVGAFSDCSRLTNVEIPDSVTSVKSMAFSGCESLIKIKVSKSVISIGTNAFPSTTILLVEENSYAHTFAEENNLLYFILVADAEPEIYTLSGITYYIMNNEAIAITAETSLTDVIIPATVEGYPVTDIKEVFREHTLLRSIIFPNSITAIGNSAFYDCENLISIKIPDSVLSIGSSAFSYCTSLASVEIPDSVTTIGDYAFSGCTNLTNIEMSDSITSIGRETFSDCSSLADIEVPDSVTSIGIRAFYNCSNLISIEIPESVTSISDFAFLGCRSLIKAKIPKSVTLISKNAFPSTTVLLVEENSYAHTFAEKNEFLYFLIANGFEPEIHTQDGITYCIINGEATIISAEDSVTDIIIPATVEGYPMTDIRTAFKGHPSLRSIILPNSITFIDNSAFSDCSSLTNIEIPDSVTSIGNSAFYDCSSLTNVKIPDSVTTIDDCAFWGCTSLTNIKIPDGVTVIDGSVFRDCSRLVSVEIPNSVTSIGGAAFSDCSSLISIDIPNSVTSIDSSAFFDCSKLTNIELSESITSIDDFVFYNCSRLANVEIPDGVTSIGNSAFFGCSRLASIKIADSVTTIGNCAFSDCSSLTNIKIPDDIVSIGISAFSGCTGLKQIRIPSAFEQVSINVFPSTTIWLVDENSPACTYAEAHDVLYFVLRDTANPEISYGAGVSGTVTTTDGTPIANATVEILYDDGEVKETVKTDESGAYSFTYAEVGAYTIRATAGNASGTERVAVKRMNAFDVFLTGETDIVLKGAYSVSGAVSPSDATVTLTDTTGNVIKALQITNGTYTFTNVPNGTYIIKVETENGCAVREVTVFNANVTVDEIEITAVFSATINGTVSAEARDGSYYTKNYASVFLRDSNGTVVAQTKTEADGSYSFNGISSGNYSIIAEAEEQRPDKFDAIVHPHKLSGYAYAEITQTGTYTFDIIICEEDLGGTATVSGKVTAQGETQPCKVVLADVSGNEIAICRTGNNGKYTFENVNDGVFFITATTPSDGMGFTVVTVREGKVSGDTDFHVWKSDKVKNHEAAMQTFMTGCTNAEMAKTQCDWIASEKRWYDSLSSKEKKQCSDEYTESLMTLIGWITECESQAAQGASISGAEQLLSGDELESGETFTLTLEIKKSEATEIGEAGIQTDEQFVQQSIENTASDKEIVAYYDISLSKTDSQGTREIKSVARDTDTTGKVRITMEIPEEYRGHKHYHFVHVHNGEPMTLVDLDDDPDTITFEIDRFSTFALTYTAEELAIDGEIEEENVVATNFGEVNAYIRNISYTDDSGATRYRIILLAAIDGLNYREVGFEITANGKTRSDGTNTVYSSVKAYNSDGNVITVTPANFRGNSAYIFAQKYTFSESYKGAVVTFRPYAVDFSGNYIYGKETTIDAIYNK